MSLVIIIDRDRNVDEHARRAVKEIMKYAMNPYAPMLPEKADVYMRHHCDEGHAFWAPMDYHNGLCSECRNDPAIREKWAD